MNKLQENIENISDDFQSTFSQQGPTTLFNMLQGEHEFFEVTAIIKKYCGDHVKVEFTKTNSLGTQAYDVYLIEVGGLL